MADRNKELPKPHPRIRALEENEDLIHYEGFMGTSSNEDLVRLYLDDHDTSSYLEIPEDAIRYTESDESVPGKVLLYVDGQRRITFVHKHTFAARDEEWLFSNLIPKDFWGGKIGIWPCDVGAFSECETRYIGDVADARASSDHKKMHLLIEVAQHRLWTCLNQACTNPFPRYRGLKIKEYYRILRATKTNDVILQNLGVI